jgi:hypothetical protein
MHKITLEPKEHYKLWGMAVVRALKMLIKSAVLSQTGRYVNL